MRKILLTTFLTVPLLFLLYASSPVIKEDGDTWWYVNGDRYYWHYQPDVFAFKNINGAPWQGGLDTNCAKYIFHRAMANDKMNVLYFKPECTTSEKESIKEVIRASANFETEFPVITLFPEQPYDAKAWFVIDDLLLVNFEKDSLNINVFNSFKRKYGIEQINFPDSVFPEGIVTYVFQMNADVADKEENTIDLARTIYMQKPGLVKNVQPNLIYAYEEASGSNISLSTPVANMDASGIEYYLINTQNDVITLVVDFKIANPQAIIKVYDLFGREMTDYHAHQQKESIKIFTDEFTSGIYFVSIETKKGEPVIVEKFLKL